MQLATVVAEYGDRCFYCIEGPAETIDHLIPKAKGGGDHMGNLRPCCEIDNAIKGTMLPPEWDAYRQTSDYRRKYDGGYGTYRSGIARRLRKREADKARKEAQRSMRVAAASGDPEAVGAAAEAARKAIAAARELRIDWDAIDAQIAAEQAAQAAAGQLREQAMA
jgi:hypothetical protein